MMLKYFRHQRNSRHLRLRVESCVNIILDLNAHLGEGKIRPEIVEQFDRLRKSLSFVTDDSVDEKDIDRIEEATNELLAEIGSIYRDHVVDFVDEYAKH